MVIIWSVLLLIPIEVLAQYNDRQPTDIDDGIGKHYWYFLIIVINLSYFKFTEFWIK